VPDLAIVDSHVHLWNPRRLRTPWLDSLPILNQPYGLQEYEEATAGLNIAGIVYLQIEVSSPYALIEARDIVTLAEADPRVLGVVPWAPLEDGNLARAFLEALVELGPRVKGVRRLIQSEADPNFCLQPGFVQGVQLLSEFGLSFDLCIVHGQLAGAIELVRRCPETSFILDHIGKPDIRHNLLDPWREQIRELASLENVVCKVSGVVTEADHDNWTVDDVAPYVIHVLDAFGEDRVVFGSDWPVVLLASSYRRWVETLDQLTNDRSADARRKLWSDNARRFYRLGDN
jgi:L-fuconolactonase